MYRVFLGMSSLMLHISKIQLMDNNVRNSGTGNCQFPVFTFSLIINSSLQYFKGILECFCNNKEKLKKHHYIHVYVLLVYPDNHPTNYNQYIKVHVCSLQTVHPKISVHYHSEMYSKSYLEEYFFLLF